MTNLKQDGTKTERHPLTTEVPRMLVFVGCAWDVQVDDRYVSLFVLFVTMVAL